MEQQKQTKQKKFSPAKNLLYMNVTRTSCILSNLQITLIIVCILFIFASILYPILSMLNYMVAILLLFILIIGTLGLMLLQGPLEQTFQKFIIFPLESSEYIFTIIEKSLPIVSGILIGLSVLTLLTQIFYNKQRASFRIVFAVLGIIAGILGFVIKI